MTTSQIRNPHGAIVMAAYRPDAERLSRQLSSIANQTVTEWDCLVVVDGTDPLVVETVRATVGADDRFRVLEFPHRVGFYRNFERGLQAVPQTAAWVALSDQDDYWQPSKLARLIPLLRDHSLATGQANIVRDGAAHGVTRRKAASLDALMADNQVTGSFSVFRRELLEWALPFPEPRPPSYHDHWLGACALVGEGIGVVPDALQDYVQHGSNVIGEASGARTRARLRRLIGSAHGWRHVLIHDRLGWRRVMARTLLERGVAQAQTLPVLRRWALARGGLAWGLLRMIASGRIPPARGCALVAAVMLETRQKAGHL